VFIDQVVHCQKKMSLNIPTSCYYRFKFMLFKFVLIFVFLSLLLLGWLSFKFKQQ
jgi:hypothetical protein